jgi:hypothetical protein
VCDEHEARIWRWLLETFKQSVGRINVQRFSWIDHDRFAAGLVRRQINEIVQSANFIDRNLLTWLALARRRLLVRGPQCFRHEFAVVRMRARREPATALTCFARGIIDRGGTCNRLRKLAHELELADAFPAAEKQRVRKRSAALQDFLPLRLMPWINR